MIQVPYEASAGTAALGVNNHGQIASFLFDVAPAAPEFFKSPVGFLIPTPTGGQGQTISTYMTGDGELTPFLPTGATLPAGTRSTDLSVPGLPVSVTVGGVKAPITFLAIPPGLAGVTQINFTIPASTPVGVQPVVVTVGGVSSTPASVMVTAAAGK